MANFRLTNQSGTTLQYVDPTDFRHTAVVKWSIQRKLTQGSKNPASLFNSRWSLKENSVLPVTLFNVTEGTENVSIETTVSGSVDNKGVIAKKLAVHIANLQALSQELLAGLPPQAVTLITELPSGA